MERRRLNTEYMEQIEKERQELMREPIEEPKTHLKRVEEPKEITLTEDEHDVEMKEVMNKSLEELEAERDALLQQVRNPDPPVEPKIQEATKAAVLEVPNKLKTNDGNNLDIRRQAQQQNVEVNGDSSRLKAALEGSREDSSPCSQVS